MPRYLLDMTSRVLDLEEPGLRVIDADDRNTHVASVLPDSGGFEIF